MGPSFRWTVIDMNVWWILLYFEDHEIRLIMHDWKLGRKMYEFRGNELWSRFYVEHKKITLRSSLSLIYKSLTICRIIPDTSIQNIDVNIS